MRSTSCKEIAQELLDLCVSGKPPKELPRALLQETCGQSLFGILVEGLADRFEPSLCDIYARLFSQAVAHAAEGVEPAALVARYERVRRIRPISSQPKKVYVLSRVTLGADVVVTSVLMAAAKRRFPDACIRFVGPSKNSELFAGDPQIHHVPVIYRRGGLHERLAVWEELKTLLSDDDSIVIDPDSRLTQLGLLPVCHEERYHLFESRAYGGTTDRPLSELASAWAAETFGVKGARPYIAMEKDPAEPRPSKDVKESTSAGETACATSLEAVLSMVGQAVSPAMSGSYIAISLGVGENPAKRLPEPFEESLLAILAETGMELYIDKGAGGEEAERVERAVQRSGIKPIFWQGSFAGFAAIIAGSRLYVGYDSAGQHVAAACRVPLISVFAGFPSPRMFERWRPVGEKCEVIRVDRQDVTEILRSVRAALSRLPVVVS